MNITQNYLGQLELSLLSDLAMFVTGENFNHHCEPWAKVELQKDAQNIYKEELRYLKNSSFYIAKDVSGNIQGSIRVTKWDYETELPLQKLFNINPIDTLDRSQQVSSIWHIGRFATSKNSTDKSLFKRLMVHAVRPICREENSVAFAECDRKLLRVMNLLGIETRVIGKSLHYLGSETVPISMSSKGLTEFYRKNEYLATSVG